MNPFHFIVTRLEIDIDICSRIGIGLQSVSQNTQQVFQRAPFAVFALIVWEPQAGLLLLQKAPI